MDVIPEDIKNFLRRYVDSIAEWEALLLLHKKRDGEWDAQAIADSLYINKQDAGKLLIRLARKKMIAAVKNQEDTMYHYQPDSAEVDELVSRGADLYSKYLIPMTHFIHSKPQSRIQEFADAFRLRKD